MDDKMYSLYLDFELICYPKCHLFKDGGSKYIRVRVRSTQHVECSGISVFLRWIGTVNVDNSSNKKLRHHISSSGIYEN
jgi:hypothetical protein